MSTISSAELFKLELLSALHSSFCCPFQALPIEEVYSQTAEFMNHENGRIFEISTLEETYTLALPLYEKNTVKVTSRYRDQGTQYTVFFALL